MVNTEQNQASHANRNAKWWKSKKGLCVVFLSFIGLSIYSSPQSFINLWLTRDQQAMIYFNKGEYDKAESLFNDTHWAAYSFYLNGEFIQAAKLYGQLNTISARFSQANALAHAAKYQEAAKIYRQILAEQATHKGAKNNLQRVKKLLETRVSSPASSMDGEVSGNQRLGGSKSQVKKKQLTKSAPLRSDAIWLKQVQENPEKFLKKKFKQEYINAIQ